MSLVPYLVESSPDRNEIDRNMSPCTSLSELRARAMYGNCDASFALTWYTKRRALVAISPASLPSVSQRFYKKASCDSRESV